MSLGKTPPTKNGKERPSRANSSEDELFRSHLKKDNDSLVISNEFLARDCEREIKTALSHKGSNGIAPTTPAVAKIKPEFVNKAESLPRKRGRNRRSNKHTKSCELDFSNFPEELQKSLLDAGSNPTVRSGTTTKNGVSKEINKSLNLESQKEPNIQLGNSLKKKGHRRSKSQGTGKTYATPESKTGMYFFRRFEVQSVYFGRFAMHFD